MIRETITFTFDDEAQQAAFRKMLTIGPDGWREADEVQRQEIARLSADVEWSVKRIAELESAMRSLLTVAEADVQVTDNPHPHRVACIEAARAALQPKPEMET